MTDTGSKRDESQHSPPVTPQPENEHEAAHKEEAIQAMEAHGIDPTKAMETREAEAEAEEKAEQLFAEVLSDAPEHVRRVREAQEEAAARLGQGARKPEPTTK